MLTEIVLASVLSLTMAAAGAQLWVRWSAHRRFQHGYAHCLGFMEDLNASLAEQERGAGVLSSDDPRAAAYDHRFLTGIVAIRDTLTTGAHPDLRSSASVRGCQAALVAASRLRPSMPSVDEVP